MLIFLDKNLFQKIDILNSTMNLIKVFTILLLSFQMTMAINRKGYFFERLQKYPWWQRVWEKYQQQKTTTTILPTISTTMKILPTISTTTETLQTISITTPPTTSPLTTEENSSENNEIITQYKIVQNITRPKLFGFSREEADSFPSRISELVLPFSQQCNHTNLPKFTTIKIMELKTIFNNNKCTTQTNQPAIRNSARASSPSSASENWQQNAIKNPDGSVTRVRRCLEKATLTKNNNLRLCAECQAVTELPENM